MAKDKSGKDGKRKRLNEFLFIDARNTGEMINRTQKAFSNKDIEKLASIYHSWRNKNGDFQDIPGLCKSATLNEIKLHDYVLTPGRYVPSSNGSVSSDRPSLSDLVAQFFEVETSSQKISDEICNALAAIGFTK
jgi:type I restriction enzyme M protein